jgi:hypothetical protein
MDENNVEKIRPDVKRTLTVQEQQAIEHGKRSSSVKSYPIFRSIGAEGKEALELAYDNSLGNQNANELLDARILQATGTINRTTGLHLLTTAGQAIVSNKSNNKEIAERLDGLAQTMQTLAPQDEYEGQLVAQLVVLHEHAMDWLGRANRTERVDFANVYLNGASKLLTRHHETLDALLKYRKKGEQRVHVEHVHVHEGGQAIVGNVTPGGGMNQKLEEGPHAKV